MLSKYYDYIISNILNLRSSIYHVELKYKIFVIYASTHKLALVAKISKTKIKD